MASLSQGPHVRGGPLTSLHLRCAVIRQYHRRDASLVGTRICELFVEAPHMVHGDSPDLASGFDELARSRACQPAEDQDVQKRVSHEPIRTVYPAAYLAGHEKAGHGCGAVRLVRQSAVLIVERRVNEHGELADVDAVSLVEYELGRELLLDCALTLQQVDHGGIEPHAGLVCLSRHRYPLAHGSALSNDACGLDISRLALEHELLPVYVHKIRTGATYLFSDEQPLGLFGEYCASGVVLCCMEEAYPDS